jgi:hypothetical protein
MLKDKQRNHVERQAEKPQITLPQLYISTFKTEREERIRNSQVGFSLSL